MSESTTKTEGRTINKWVLTFIVVLLIAFNASIRLIHLKEWHYLKKVFFISESRPLMTTQDAYYYLRLASDYKKGNFQTVDNLSPIGVKPRPVSLLSLIDASISRLTGTTLEKVAYYLPVFLSCLMVFAYLSWGFALEDTKFFTISALIGSSVFYWYTRTCLGRFDTDSLLPFFTLMIPYFTYRFCISAGIKHRILHGVLVIILSALFFLWWIPARYLIVPLIFFTYAISLFCVKTSRAEQIVKLCILIAGTVIGVLVVLMWFSIIPAFGIFHRVLGLLQLAIHKGNSVFPDVSVSISELAPLSFTQLTGKVAGNPIILIASFAGLIWLIAEKRNVFIFLIVPLALAFLSLKSRRFMIFFIPFFSMGAAFAIYKIADMKFFKKNKFLEYTVVCFLTAITLYFVGKKTIKFVVPPNPTSVHASIVATVNDGYKPDETVWSWWDYGYFLEYMTAKKAFIDGGSQDGMRSFLAAYPLTQPNPQVAAYWIRLFSIRNAGFFWTLTRYAGSEKKALDFLKKAFESPDEIHLLKKEYRLPPKNWKELLFPGGKVYLYLPFDMLDTSVWWFYFGTWDFENNKGHRPVVLKVSPRSLLDQKKGVLIFSPAKRILLKDMLTYSTNPNIGLYASKAFGNPSDKHLITGRSFGYVVDDEFLKSTFAKLLFSPDDLPQFKLLKYVPSYGGIWEVVEKNP